MEVINKVNNRSLLTNLQIYESNETRPYYNSYGNIEYDDESNQKYVNVNTSEFIINDNYSTLNINFLGSDLNIEIRNSDQISFITLLTNIEIFGEKWWETYKKFNDDAFLLTVSDKFIKHVDTNIKSYFREKNIDEVLNE